MGIRAKLLLPFLMAFAVMAALIQWFWVPQYLQHEVDTWNKHQNEIINAIKPYLVRDILSGDFAALHMTLEREFASHSEEWRQLVLYSANGKQLYPLNPQPVLDMNNLSRLHHNLQWKDRSIGTLVLTASYGHELEEEKENVYRLGLVGLLVLGIFTVLATYWQNLWIRIPIIRLQRAAASLANGDANVPLPKAGNDELGQLTRTFGNMRNDLQAALSDVQASETRYRAVFDNAVDGIITINQNGMIESFNKSAEKIFGYPANEAIDQSFSMLMTKQCFTEYLSYMQEYMKSGKARILGEQREISGQRKDGSILPINLAVSEILINESRLFCGVVSDITERKQAETAIKQANKLMSSLVDNLQVGILVEDENRQVLQANQFFCDLFDIDSPPSALIGSDGTKGVSEVKRFFTNPDHFINSSERCIAWKEVVVGEELNLADDRVFERDYIPVDLQSDGQTVKQAHLWCYRNITSRKRIEAAVQQQSEQLELAAAEERALSTLLRLALKPMEMEMFLDKVLNEVMTDIPWLKLQPKGAIFLTEKEGRGKSLLLASEYGLDAELQTLCAHVPFGHCLCGRAAAERSIQFSSCMDHRHDIRFEKMEPHGHYNAPLMQDDKVLGVIVFYLPHGHEKSDQEMTFIERVADVVSMGISRLYANTALLQAKIAAESAAKAKSAFLATMSHEIRTPMNGVLGMTQILSDTELNDMQRQYLDTISESGKALLVVINDILDFSKIEAGKLTLDPVTFDLERAAHEVCQLLTGVSREKGLELILSYAPNCPRRLNGDAGRLRQILMNLLGNAIKFTSSGHVLIEINALSQNNNEVKLRIAVKDTGIGISQEVQSKLFNAFTQADGSTTRNFGGTGLGLAISKQLVELMNGQIGVESIPDEGSTFWFTLSLPIAGKIEPMARAELKGIHVLLVDDHPVNRQVLSEQLRPLGMIVDTCADADSALTRLLQAADSESPFDIAVLDYFMPGQDGEQLAHNIRATTQLADLPLVMLTSGPQRGDTRRLNEAGFSGYLTKPILNDTLAETLAAVLGTTRDGDMKRMITRHDVAELDKQTRETKIACFSGQVLLVEDVEVNQQVATIMLKQVGLSVDVASNGQEALDLWLAGKYDLILMDCQMPVMDGYQATMAIREAEQSLNHRVPIVALTANATESDRDSCLAAGMDDFLVKPFEQLGLLDILKNYLPIALAQASDQQSLSADTEAVTVEIDTTDNAVIDQERFNQIAELMGEDFDTLIHSFISSSDETLIAMKNAAENKQADIYENKCHSLCGISSNIGASRLLNLACELQKIAIELDTDDALNWLGRLNTVFLETKKCMLISLSAIKKQQAMDNENSQKEVIDHNQYESMRNSIGEQVFAQLIPTFLDSVKDMLEEISLARKTGDYTDVLRLAHSIKSASGNVGAVQLSEQAKSLEIRAKNNDLDNLDQYLDELNKAFADVQQALELKSA